MPVANNMGQLENMFRQHLQKAMRVVQAKAEEDMFEETGMFYTVGTPKLYPRTGGLGSSPRTTALSVGGNSVSFEAYLEPPDYSAVNAYLQSLGYQSYFSGMQVLTAAEQHRAHILGKPYFWSRAKKKIERDFYNTMQSFFS